MAENMDQYEQTSTVNTSPTCKRFSLTCVLKARCCGSGAGIDAPVDERPGRRRSGDGNAGDVVHGARERDGPGG